MVLPAVVLRIAEARVALADAVKADDDDAGEWEEAWSIVELSLLRVAGDLSTSTCARRVVLCGELMRVGEYARRHSPVACIFAVSKLLDVAEAALQCACGADYNMWCVWEFCVRSRC